MSFNKSTHSFDDVRGVLDRALESPKGLRIPCASRGAAIRLRSRFNYFRFLDRRQNANTYPAEDPMSKRSIYDKLYLRIPAKGQPDEHILFIEPYSALEIVVEEIT